VPRPDLLWINNLMI